jgi:mannan endo-1,4-beta-mannosidase
VRRDLPPARLDPLWTGVRARLGRHRRRRAIGRAALGTALAAAVAVGAIGVWRGWLSKGARSDASAAPEAVAARRPGLLPRWVPSFGDVDEGAVRAPGSASERERAVAPPESVAPPAPGLAEDNDRRASGFLTRQGRQLLLDGRPFRFLGFTAFTLAGCGKPDEVPGPEELDAFFASLRPPAVVRTLALEDYPLARVELIVETAARHGHKLILILADHDAYCGQSAKTSSWYAEGYRTSYLPWVRKVVGRFAESPAVGMWELVKGTVLRNDAPVLRAFYDEVGGEIRKLAPRHLVASGSHGTWAYGGETGYRLVHASPGIDVAMFHDYNNTWGEASSLPSALAALEGLDKPLVLGAVAFYGSRLGDPRKLYAGRPCLSWAVREQAMRVKVDATFRLPVAGATIWSWMPRGRPESCRLETYPGDPLVDFAAAYRPPPYP